MFIEPFIVTSVFFPYWIMCLLYFLFLADPVSQIIYIIFWGLIIIACIIGPDFVDSPKLVQVEGKKKV